MLAAFRLEKELRFGKRVFLCVRAVQIKAAVAEFRLLFQTPFPPRREKVSETAPRYSGNNTRAEKVIFLRIVQCLFHQKLKSRCHFVPTLTECTLPSARQ